MRHARVCRLILTVRGPPSRVLPAPAASHAVKYLSARLPFYNVELGRSTSTSALGTVLPRWRRCAHDKLLTGRGGMALEDVFNARVSITQYHVHFYELRGDNYHRNVKYFYLLLPK